MTLPEELERAAADAGAIVRIGYPWWLRAFVQRNTIAITLGRRVYISAAYAGGDLRALLRHELVHVAQVRELGLVTFLGRYVAEYIRNRRRGMPHDAAYLAISFEREAFAAERDPLI